MPRGYRCIIFTAFVWLISVGASPTSSEKPQRLEQRHIREDLRPALDIIADSQRALAAPSDYQRPCLAREYNNRSDLCAQWDAALSSREAAFWSEASFWIAFAGTVLSGLGIVLILRNLTRDHIAQRPYVFLHKTLKTRDPKTHEILKIDGINFQNFGKSFAYVQAVTVRSCIGLEPPPPKSIDLERYPANVAIIPDEPWPVGNAIPIRSSRPSWVPTASDVEKLFVSGRMIYQDPYGQRYHLWFCRIYANGSFAYDPADHPILETFEYNGTKRLSKIGAWLLLRRSLARTGA